MRVFIIDIMTLPRCNEISIKLFDSFFPLYTLFNMIDQEMHLCEKENKMKKKMIDEIIDLPAENRHVVRNDSLIRHGLYKTNRSLS